MGRMLWIVFALGLIGCSSDEEAGSKKGSKKEPNGEPIAAETLLPAGCGHAHNDYEHDRPLYDAIELGFCSIEVDVFLEGDELLVAHFSVDLDPSRTLQSLYLDPLRALNDAGDLPTPASGESVILLIDVKTDAATTYAALDPILASYDDVLTRFEGGEVYAGPVTALISGNRDQEALAAQTLRYAALDGRTDDLGQGIALDVMPLISSSWGSHFDWAGTGDMPADERDLLEQWVADAHAENRRLRFWASPDTQEAWQVLVDAGADLVNTDDLAGLASFLDGS